MAFGEKFSQDGPLGSSQANLLDEYIRADTKIALAERYELEHYPLDSDDTGATTQSNPNAQGRHVAGRVGCVGYGTWADLEAASEQVPGNGALWLLSDKHEDFEAGTLLIYNSGWEAAQFATGTIYATYAEVIAGTETAKAISPAVMVPIFHTKYVNPIYNNLIIREVQAPTIGGTPLSAGTNIISLNTEVVNNIEGSSFSATTHRITLPAGEYRVVATVPCWVGAGVMSHYARAILWDVNGGDYVVLGASLTFAWYDFGRYAFIDGYFTLTDEETELDLRFYIDVVGSQNPSAGSPCSDGYDEIYSTIEIIKLDADE